MTDQRASHAPELAIIGAGQYSALVAELAETCGYHVVCYLDDDPGKQGTSVQGVPVRGPIAAGLPAIPRDVAVAVALGDNDARSKWLVAARQLGYRVPALVSPLATVSPSAEIGDGVHLHPGCHVWTQARVGLGSVLSPGTTVAHHTTLGEGCFAASGANIGASINVGRGAFFGIGSVTSTGVANIAEHTLVGAGAVIIRDTEPYGVYVGSPGRLLRVAAS